MRKSFFLACVLAVSLPSLGYSDEFTEKEVKGLEVSKKWRKKTGLVANGDDGKVIFLYGSTQPSVVCAPLQVCDIELEDGEELNDVMVGDSVRWKVKPAVSGIQPHLVVNPTEPDLVTSMVIMTSKRTYQLQLRSHETDYMPRVGFEYPESVNARLEAIKTKKEASIIPGAQKSPENLNFNFSVDGNARWKPQRIYTDGLKTYIQFPDYIQAMDAPVLFVQSGNTMRTVNYRLKDTMLVADAVIDGALLISGVGKNQEKIFIRRTQ